MGGEGSSVRGINEKVRGCVCKCETAGVCSPAAASSYDVWCLLFELIRQGLRFDQIPSSLPLPHITMHTTHLSCELFLPQMELLLRSVSVGLFSRAL